MGRLPALLISAALLGGCGRNPEAAGGRDHSQEKEAGEDHDHDHEHGPDSDHGEASHSGATFEDGKGVVVMDETRRILGVQVAEVALREIPSRIGLMLQVFGEKHRHPLDPEDHTGCDVHGSGFVSMESSLVVRPGQPVVLPRGTNAPLGGVVISVQKAVTLGESEIVIGVSNAMAILRAGEFVPARIDLPRGEPVPAIPASALLRASQGTFVYVVRGEAFSRIAVQVGSEADGWVEIREGLSAGERVVTQPVRTLWLIELRATKGGGHSH
ncbi:MAG: efflux RND transporter periplasmic adaptor subunit [Limisphaerales bacterium]